MSGFSSYLDLWTPGSTKRGAGEGNRTPVYSLGSCRSTIELHPQDPQSSGVSSTHHLVGSSRDMRPDTG